MSGFPQYHAIVFVMTKSEEWAAAQAARVGATVQRLRDGRSGQWLSNETATAGHRISRTSISELESGKRKSVTTAELCVLAWALRVPPIRLLYPDLPDGPVEIVPGKEVPSIEAATWFSGEVVYEPEIPEPAGRRLTDDELQEIRDVYGGAELVKLARERITLDGQTRTLSRMVARLRKSKEPGVAETVESLVEQITTAESRIKAVNERLRLLDGAVVNDGG